jgi:hypothetical protein
MRVVAHVPIENQTSNALTARAFYLSDHALCSISSRNRTTYWCGAPGRILRKPGALSDNSLIDWIATQGGRRAHTTLIRFGKLGRYGAMNPRPCRLGSAFPRALLFRRGHRGRTHPGPSGWGFP